MNRAYQVQTGQVCRLLEPLIRIKRYFASRLDIAHAGHMHGRLLIGQIHRTLLTAPTPVGRTLARAA